MIYRVCLARDFAALQGLGSPVRDAKGLGPLQPTGGYDLTIQATIVFDESQLTDRGWFVDTDAVEDVLQATADYLASDKWTRLFEFRPTFELVSRWAYYKLAADIPQLASVKLINRTIGTATEYTTRQ